MKIWKSNSCTNPHYTLRSIANAWIIEFEQNERRDNFDGRWLHEIILNSLHENNLLVDNINGKRTHSHSPKKKKNPTTSATLCQATIWILCLKSIHKLWVCKYVHFKIIKIYKHRLVAKTQGYFKLFVVYTETEKLKCSLYIGFSIAFMRCTETIGAGAFIGLKKWILLHDCWR